MDVSWFGLSNGQSSGCSTILVLFGIQLLGRAEGQYWLAVPSSMQPSLALCLALAWPAPPPPLPHSNAVDSSGQHQGPHAVDGGGDANARAVSGGDADARAVSSRRADPACAGPGDALPSFSMRPTQHPKRTAEQAVAAGQGGKGYSKPWTVVVFLVLPHMLLCRQSWLWCVAASGCLLSLHYILHIAFGCVLQCLVPPCTPQPVCRHRG